MERADLSWFSEQVHLSSAAPPQLDMNKLLLIWLLEVALVAFCGGNQSFHEGKGPDKIYSQNLLAKMRTPGTLGLKKFGGVSPPSLN